MKKSMIVAAIAALAVFTGCKSIEIERDGQSLATIKGADGTEQVVKDAAGNPIILDGGWSVDYFQHGNWQKFDSLTAEAGSAKLAINNYESGMDTNLTALVAASMDGATKLVTAIGEAYVKIAGGGAQASTVLTTAQSVYEYFTKAGGDATKAAVTDVNGAVKVTDGATCVTCDAAGNCSTCSP